MKRRPPARFAPAPLSLLDLSSRQRWMSPQVAVCAALLAVAAAVLAPPNAALAAPSTLQFEGALRSVGGGPATDGPYDLTIAVYAEAQGGVALWSEKTKATVAGGTFAVALGATQALNVAALAKAPALFIGVSVASDPELPRLPIHASLFSLHAASADVAAGLQCTGCVSLSALQIDGDLDLKGNALKAGAIAATTISADKATAKELTAQSITAAQYLGDGSKLTGIALPSGNCPSGQVVVGVAADGKLSCASSAASLPTDGLDEISNNLLTTQFQETFLPPAKDIGVAIPDNTGAEAVSTITVGEVGTAEGGLEVTVEVANSDLSSVAITLLPPDDKKVGYTLCDPCGKSQEKSYKATFPKPTALQVGDLTKWTGKSPKGLWTLRVKDTGFCIPQLDKIHCNVANSTDGKLVTWSLGFAVQSTKLVGVQGTLSFGTGGSAHAAVAALGQALLGQAVLVKGIPGLWTLLAPDWTTQQSVETPGQIVYRTDVAKAYIRLGKEWRELQTTPMCGDSVRAGSEVCDLQDLAGKDCASAYGPGSNGVLACKTDCSGFDISKCSEPPTFAGTKILDAAGIAKVNGWYGDANAQWSLCYRRSEHGAQASTFHNLCNNKGPSISLIKTNTNQIFGGYNPLSWKSSGSYANTTQSFLFSVTNNAKFPYCNNAANSVYDAPNYGPTWGGNHDLYVEGNMTTGYANPGYSHCCPNPPGCNSCTACQNLMAGSYNSWQIVELEVWVKK